MRENWQDLANAIIIQAVKDHRRAQRVLKAHQRHIAAKKIKDETESFFRSDWYRALTNVDGEVLIKRLNSEV